MSSDNNLVYSTETGRIKAEKPTESIPESDGVVRIRRETKGRKGKGVTCISGLGMNEKDLKNLAKEIKKRSGTGGSVKDFVIEIQGDQRELAKEILEKKGFKVKFSGG